MIPREQLRMTDAERDAFLAEQRTLRLATVDGDGFPHVVPLWFVWHEGAVWLNSLVPSRRHGHLRAGRPVGLVVDSGQRYGELRGVRMTGTPRVVPEGDPTGTEAMRRFGDKYFGGEVPARRSYETVMIRPARIVSWDFAKIPAGRDRKVGRDRP